jgi:AcrR family transcriptional regulator
VARPRTHDEALRQRLLDLAGKILAGAGQGALSLRGLAQQAGTSTSAVYALFGGKPALLRAVYADAFARLRTLLAAVPVTADPAADLVALGLAYRASALASPHLYPLMFGRDPAGVVIGEAELAVASGAFGILADAIQRCVGSGTFPQGSGRRLTLAAWALVHGLVSLELDGRLPPGGSPAEDYEQILRETVSGWSAAGRTRTAQPGHQTCG